MQNTIQDSFFIDSLRFNKEAKKNAHFNSELAALLAQLQNALNSAKGAQEASGSTNAVAGSVAEMMGILELLQGFISKMGSQLNQMNAKVDQANIVKAQEALKEVQDKIKKIEEQEANQSVWSKIAEAFEGILGVILACLGQFEMAAVTFAMLALSASGGFQKIGDLITHALEKDGVSEKVAKLLGSVLTIAITIAVTVIATGGSGALSAEGALEEGAEEGTELTTFASEGIEEGEESVVAEEGNAQSLGKKMALFSTVTGSQALMGSGFSQDLVGLILEHVKNWSDKQKSALEGTLTIVIQLLATVAAGAASWGLIADSAGSSAMGVVNRIAQALKTGNISSIMTGALIAQGTAGGLQAGAMTAEAVVAGNLGTLQRALGDSQADLALFQSLSHMMDAAMASEGKNLMSTLETHNQEIQESARKLGAEQAAIARELAS